jgi:cytochrome c-type protein NapB
VSVEEDKSPDNGGGDSLFPVRESLIPKGTRRRAFFEERARRRRLYQLLAAFSVGAAFVGAIIGSQGPSEALPPNDTLEGEGEGAAARSYSDLRAEHFGPNADIYKGAFALIRNGGPGFSDPVVQSEKQRREALDRRAKRRAYAGAPPTIPHSIQEKDPSACMACHGEGGEIAGLRIAPLSHQYLTMCTQCHATSREEDPEIANLSETFGKNNFQRLDEPGSGDRAWEGAPPRIPHAVFMRENCESCHGLKGEPGLRSTHPQRENCEQCHAPSSKFDQAGPPVFGEWPPAL